MWRMRVGFGQKAYKTDKLKKIIVLRKKGKGDEGREDIRAETMMLSMKMCTSKKVTERRLRGRFGEKNQQQKKMIALHRKQSTSLAYRETERNKNL
mmetsp:Transcript_1875/g.4147  ORF Transcript_1875/g.4147 Transcript_1875/m.4147 type:complete len:96 (+) Transcript_1875:1965-2252(+)